MEEMFNVIPDAITEEEWNEIHLIAVRMFNTQKFGDNQFRVAIFAFLHWLSITEREIQVIEEVPRNYLAH